jgi:hypothetical protein
MVKRRGRKAGIAKDVHPHMLRLKPPVTPSFSLAATTWAAKLKEG